MSGPERTQMFQMPATAQGRLVGFEGSVKGRAFPLSTGTFVIGRGDTCDMALKDSGVSRQHAKIVAEGESYILLDMESRNGTFVNGKPMRKATLREGDEIRICGAAFRFTFLEIGGSFVPPEMDLDDPTGVTDDDDAPTDRHPNPVASTAATTSGAAVRPSTQSASVARPVGVSDQLRLLKIVVIVALVAALIAISAGVGVVISLRRSPVIAEKRPDPSEKPVEAKPVAPEAKPIAPVAVADAGAVETKPVDPEAKPVDPEAKPVDPEARPVDPEAKPVEPETKPPIETKPDVKPDPKPKQKPVEKKATPTEWLPVRTGPEIVRAPAAGSVTSVSATAVAGTALVVIDGATIQAPATGALSATVKVGDTVRKGQILGRIAEPRVRADVPAALARKAKKGAKVELQIDGGVKSATIVDVVDKTILIDAGGAAVTGVRFP